MKRSLILAILILLISFTLQGALGKKKGVKKIKAKAGTVKAYKTKTAKRSLDVCPEGKKLKRFPNGRTKCVSKVTKKNKRLKKRNLNLKNKLAKRRNRRLNKIKKAVKKLVKKN